jgi:hypothetical protein
VIELFAPPSLGFGSGSDATIYFEVEFRGVQPSESFNMQALQDIHIGIHGTPGHKDAWTVGWNNEASGNRLFNLICHFCYYLGI